MVWHHVIYVALEPIQTNTEVQVAKHAQVEPLLLYQAQNHNMNVEVS